MKIILKKNENLGGAGERKEKTCKIQKQGEKMKNNVGKNI